MSGWEIVVLSIIGICIFCMLTIIAMLVVGGITDEFISLNQISVWISERGTRKNGKILVDYLCERVRNNPTEWNRNAVDDSLTNGVVRLVRNSGNILVQVNGQSVVLNGIESYRLQRIIKKHRRLVVTQELNDKILNMYTGIADPRDIVKHRAK